MDNWRDMFPSTPDEIAFMCVCYLALPTVAAMLIFPHKVMAAVFAVIGWIA